MKNGECSNFKIVVIIFLALVTNSKTVFAQQCSQAIPPPIPKMWVSKAKSIERELWFRFGSLVPGNRSKERVISKLTGNSARKTLSSNFPVKSFDDLIDLMDKTYSDGFDGLIVYITAFDASSACRGPLHPSVTKDKELIPIFAPAKMVGSKPTDLGKYFIINPENNQCDEISPDVKECWCTHYMNKVVRVSGGLSSTLEPGQRENETMDPVTHKTIGSDTRAIYYLYNDFKEFIKCERDYQNNFNQAKIDSIGIFFASYPERGSETNNPMGFNAYKNRLLLQFEFINDEGIFYIDDQIDFWSRMQKFSSEKKINRRYFNGGDNGTLCPPCTNCPPGTPGCN